MADWGAGYVTDTAYVHDFCRVQTPAILSLAALSRNVAAAGGRGEPLSYCDLGCGQGFTANLVAAANPRAEVFAADFNPTHIAGARTLADAASLKNIRFREAGFDELLQDATRAGLRHHLPARGLQLDQLGKPSHHRRSHPPAAQVGRIALHLLRRDARLGRDRAAAPAPRAAACGVGRRVAGRPRAGARLCRQAQGARSAVLPHVSLCHGPMGSAEEAPRLLSGA